MCFYLAVSLTSPALRFSFPLQTIVTWGDSFTLFPTCSFHFQSHCSTDWSPPKEDLWLLFYSEYSKPPNHFLVSPLKPLPTAVDWLLPFAVIYSTLLAFLQKNGLGEMPPGSFSSPCKWNHHSIASARVRTGHYQVPIFHCEMPLSFSLCWGADVSFQLQHPTAPCYQQSSSWCDSVTCPLCGAQDENEVPAWLLSFRLGLAINFFSLMAHEAIHEV